MENNFNKKLGLRIRELRLAKGIKQSELADMLDMERSNLTRICLLYTSPSPRDA